MQLITKENIIGQHLGYILTFTPFFLFYSKPPIFYIVNYINGFIRTFYSTLDLSVVESGYYYRLEQDMKLPVPKPTVVSFDIAESTSPLADLLKVSDLIKFRCLGLLIKLILCAYK